MHTVTSCGTVLYPATGAYLPVRQYAAAYTLSQRSEQFKNVQIKKKHLSHSKSRSTV